MSALAITAQVEEIVNSTQSKSQDNNESISGFWTRECVLPFAFQFSKQRQ